MRNLHNKQQRIQTLNSKTKMIKSKKNNPGLQRQISFLTKTYWFVTQKWSCWCLNIQFQKKNQEPKTDKSP